MLYRLMVDEYDIEVDAPNIVEAIVCGLRGRVEYVWPGKAKKKSGARFPSSLIGVGIPGPIGLDGILLNTQEKR